MRIPTRGYRVPFNRAWVSGRETEYVIAAVNSSHLSGDGPFSGRCQEVLREGFGHQRTLLTTSCTDALEMCALLLSLQPGDEIIVPSFTFVSTVNAFVIHGGRPVFVDIEGASLNINPAAIAGAITERTRAIVVVHYAGVACAMDEILEMAAARGIAVIEDNAHGLGGAYRGRPLGSMGQLATLSFHETKNFTAGEGGALIVNDATMLERAEIIREKGTDRSRFFRGEVDKYSWVDVGSSFLPSELVAAHLCAQLEARETIQRRRRRIWEMYRDGLDTWAGQCGIQMPVIPHDCESAYHMFHLVMPSRNSRSALIAHLGAAGMLAVSHYLPLHLSTMGQRLGGLPGQCPVTEDVSDRLLRLPFYTGLGEADQAAVIERAASFTP